MKNKQPAIINRSPMMIIPARERCFAGFQIIDQFNDINKPLAADFYMRERIGFYKAAYCVFGYAD